MISIILPARNNAVATRDCLLSLAHSLRDLNLKTELILIDDASEPREGLIELFQAFQMRAPEHKRIVLRAKRHLHYTGVFSVGLHLATLENAFFLSNDMLITPHFLLAVLAVSALSRDFGVVRGTSNYADSHPEHTVPAPDGLQTYADVLNFSKAMFEKNGLSFSQDSILSGDAILIKRAVLERVGVMDMQFFGYFGDVDFGLRCHLAGFKLVCAKGAWLRHEGAGHLKTEAGKGIVSFAAAHEARMRLVKEAYQLFRKKWGPTLPERFDDLDITQLFSIAESNVARIDLEYQLPASAHQAYEIIGTT